MTHESNEVEKNSKCFSFRNREKALDKSLEFLNKVSNDGTGDVSARQVTMGTKCADTVKRFSNDRNGLTRDRDLQRQDLNLTFETTVVDGKTSGAGRGRSVNWY